MVALSLLVVGSQGPYTIRYAPPVGQKIRYLMSIDMKQAGAAGVPPMGFRQDIYQSIRVLSRKGDRTTIEMTTDQIKVTVPKNSPMAGMKSMLESQGKGIKMTYVMDATGKIVSVKTAADKGNAVAAAAQGMAQGMSQQMGGLNLPNRPIRVGESWTVNLDMGKLMAGSNARGMKVKGTMPTTMKLLGVTGGVARLGMTIKGTMTMTMPQQNQKVTTSTSGSGTSTVDVATGLLREMKSTATTITNVGQIKMRQVMTQTMRRLG